MISKILKMFKSVFGRQQKPLSFAEMQDQIGKAYFGNYAEFCQMYPNNQEKQMLHEHFLQKCLFAMLAKNLSFDKNYHEFIEWIVLYRYSTNEYPIFEIFINREKSSVESFRTAFFALQQILWKQGKMLEKQVRKDMDKKVREKIYFAGLEKLQKGSINFKNRFNELYAE